MVKRRFGSSAIALIASSRMRVASGRNEKRSKSKCTSSNVTCFFAAGAITCTVTVSVAVRPLPSSTVMVSGTAPGQVGAVPLTITVDDGKGLTATDTVTVQVIAPAAKKQVTFEDVHFDFDRFSLRPEATRILDEAIKAMAEDPNLRFTIEGY